MPETPTDFRRWAAALGLKLGEAAALIGLTGNTRITELSQGRRELTETERLAMAAVRAGLTPWTPENDHDAADLKDIRKILDRAVEDRMPVKRRSKAA